VFGADLAPEEILAACRPLGIRAIELAASAVEAHLGKPTVPSWWLEMPENGFDTGALPLEEEILQDEVDLARQAFAARVREWRASVSLAPLEPLLRRCQDAGVRIAAIDAPDLATASDPEVDHAFRLAKALGAEALTMPLVVGEPRRLAPFAERHGMRVGFDNLLATRPADFASALAHSPRHGVSLDLEVWLAGGHGSPLPFLRQHAGHVIQVRVDAAALGGTKADEPAAEVLRDILDNGWPVRITLGLAPDADGRLDRAAILARALDYCVNGLRLST